METARVAKEESKMVKTESFKDFLMRMHAESINCTENDCLDDDLADAFDEWMALMDENIRDKYIELYGRAMFIQGYKEAMDDTNKVLERITAK